MSKSNLLGDIYMVDGNPAGVLDFTPDMSAETYYEVVRMIGGRFLFLEDHLERLANSLTGTGIPFPGKEAIKDNLRLLQRYNAFTEGNIRICIQRLSGGDQHLFCYFIPYLYPEICMYKSGVDVMTYPHVRPNPGIKKWDDRFRTSVNQFIRDTGIYEAILLNRQNEVTEGSRSNLFFITPSNQVVSAPENEILPGITRKYLLDICSKEQLDLVHRPIRLDELDQFDSCFLSGTSPKVLPVWKLNAVEFEVDHPVLHLLMERFDQVINQNLEDLRP
ncbi:MAG: aminotransferase class IV [Bacteroidales bacterium]